MSKMDAASKFDVIEDSDEAFERYGFAYGYEVFNLTQDEIDALLAGKALASNDDAAIAHAYELLRGW